MTYLQRPYLLIVALLGIFPAGICAQPKNDALFINNLGEYPVYKHLYIYETNKKLTPRFVYDSVKTTDFIKLYPNKSFNRLTTRIPYYWLLVTIKNNLPHDETFYYWLNSPDLSIAKLYQESGDGKFKLTGNSGYYISFELRQVKSHDAEFKFTIKERNTSVVLMGIENPDARVLNFLPKLADADTRRYERENYYLIMGVVLGIMLLTFLLNIFFAVTLRLKIHYLYALYVICTVYEIFNLEGIAENYFGTTDHRLAQLINHIFPLFCAFLMSRIMQWFLNQKRDNSYFKLPLDIANYLLLVIAVVYILDYFIDFHSETLLLPVLDLATGMQLLLIVLSAIEKTIQKYQYAWVYLLPLYG